MGNGVANHPSPQKGDANYGKSHVITNVNAAGGTTTITCNVGDGGTSAGVPHIYAGSLANGTILIHDPSSTTSDIPQFEDWNILLDGSNPICAGVILLYKQNLLFSKIFLMALFYLETPQRIQELSMILLVSSHIQVLTSMMLITSRLL